MIWVEHGLNLQELLEENFSGIFSVIIAHQYFHL